MFSLHETTRKRICRTAFFALCLAPTCATAAWIADHYLPWRQSSAARRFSDRYHLDVTLADWQDPRPHMTRLAAVTLAEPGGVDPLLNLRQVETHRRGDVLIVSIDELTLRIADLLALAARLEWTLARTPAQKLELHIEKLSLQKAATGGRVPLTLHRLQGVIERDPQNHPRIRLLAHLAEQEETSSAAEPEATPSAPAKPIGLSVETIIEAGASPRQVIAFDTQQNAVPVALFAPLVPGAAALADSATFNGVVSWQVDDASSGAAVAGLLRGRLEQLDLATLLPPQSPHILRGAATIELTEVRWQGEQLQHIAGTLTAIDGEVSRTLLAAAAMYLRAVEGTNVSAVDVGPVTSDAATLAAPLALDELACRFELDHDGLGLWGTVAPSAAIPAGCLIAGGSQPLLLEPPFMRDPEQRLPWVSWVQFIGSPVGQLWIPYSPTALDIAKRLPGPTSASQ